jgi:phosphohistidine phosphatase
MARHLFLLRHGKAAWPENTLDHKRPLAPRGTIAVPLIAERLKALAGRIDLAIVSSALRTQETFALLQGVIPDLEQQREPAIYEARPDVLLDLVLDLPESAKTVLMVGHNPGFHALALYLANSAASNAEALQRLERKLPTAGLVHLEIPGAWRDLGPETARLADFITPAMLGGTDED